MYVRTYVPSMVAASHRPLAMLFLNCAEPRWSPTSPTWEKGMRGKIG